MRKLIPLALALMIVLAPAATAAEHEIDGVHSTALFKVSHLGFSNTYGMFPGIEGTLNFDPETPGESAIDVTIQTESITTLHEGRDKHLKGPDFFNVKEFPTMTFKSTAWEKTGDDAYDVTGEFTMLGETKTITVPVVMIGAGEGMRGETRAGFETTFTIDRTEYGMNYMPDGIGTDVTVTFGIEAVKK